MVKRDDAQDQGACGVADSVDDHPVTAVADCGVFELVLFEEAAVVLPDACYRALAPEVALVDAVERGLNDAGVLTGLDLRLQPVARGARYTSLVYSCALA